ncbi:alpha/beta-hydrolase [Crucibulum laeve]|uniref:Carboxypeptidase n=1 Tax=Crucibulum laeve TaxID=68775 RepID=A0A5C3LSN8_9AGAR|nr:alpha/beta-hydrolase [Crucibulum laeve]
MFSARVLLIFFGIATVFLTSGTDARQIRKKELHARQLEAAKRWQPSAPVRRAAPKNITFSNPRASEFFVDGKSIPEVDFDVGPSWSGLLPISGNKNETRKLFFWFFPPGPQGSLDDLIFWTNGGPGCSSLEGLLQENGPFSWSWGQAKPTPNEFSWTNLSSVLWVEQPVGTGFSQGTPNIKNEDDLAAQLVGFMQQFLEVFSELKNKKLYVSGESYAGTYVPYIANYIYEHPGALELDLQGIWIADPSLSWDVVQTQIPAVDFVHKYENVFSFNQTFMAQLDKIAATCNYANYTKQHLTYPPTGLLPLPGKSTSADRGCDVWDMIFDAALLVNPAFNIYRIFDTFPILWDVLGFPGSFPQEQISPLYFDRADVKKVIHAPANVQWDECSNVNVFPHGDASLPSALSVLPNVIQKSQRTVIVHGLADFILIAEGTRIVIQNMTWNGLQGFQTPIANDSFIVDGVGSLGTSHSERGLTFFEVELSGHMIPQFSPKAAFQTMQYLMGFRQNP